MPQKSLRNRDDFAGGVVRVARPSGRHPYSISVTSLVAETALEGDVRGTAALVAISDPDDDFDQLAARFAALFSLTKAETRLVAALMTGKRLSEIARESGLRMPTLRARLSAVFRKTETSRQAALIRVAKSIPR